MAGWKVLSTPQAGASVRPSATGTWKVLSTPNPYPNAQPDPTGSTQAQLARGENPYAPTRAPSPVAPSYSDPLGQIYDATTGTMNSLYQGATLGGGDELAGIVGGAGSALMGQGFDRGYEAGTSLIRDRQDRFRAQNPAADITAQLAGGYLTGTRFANMIPGLAPVEGGSALGNIARGGGSGAVAGAVSGYLSGEGDNRVETALGGAALGGGIGAVIPTLTATYRGITGERPTQVEGIPFEDSAAAAIAARAIARDRQTPSALRAIVDSNAASGKPMALADMGGENVRQTLDAVVNRPGPARSIAREFFRQRQTGQAGNVGSMQEVGPSQAARLAGDVRETVSEGQFYDTIDALAAKRAKDAAPLYEEAYAAKPVLNNRAITGLLNTPMGKSALGKAFTLARNEMGADVPENVRKQAAYAARVLSDLDNFNGKRPIPFPVLDYVKRGLDDVAETYRDPVTRSITSNEGRIANSVRTRFRTELENLNPKYKEALASYSGPSALMRAVEDGKVMFGSAQPEEIAKRVSGMSAQEKEAFLIGVARNLTDRIETTPQATHNAALRILKGQDVQKLRAAGVSPERIRSLMTSVERERAMFSTMDTMKGSPTALRQANAEDLDANTFEAMLADRVTGSRSSLDLIRGGIRWLRERGTGMTNEKVRARVAEMLLSPNPQDQARALDAIERQITARNEAGRRGSAFAVAQGAALGGEVARENAFLNYRGR